MDLLCTCIIKEVNVMWGLCTIRVLSLTGFGAPGKVPGIRSYKVPRIRYMYNVYKVALIVEIQSPTVLCGHPS